MDKKIVKSPLLGQQFTQIQHSSGLTVLLCPMEGFSTSYALFAAKVGSIDTTFKTQADEDFVEVPAGIAHFLEHKMFENEEGDAFQKYAATGASANAYTSFDRTAYLFSCSDNFPQSLEILLDFVSRPYFTPQSVEKEQGIIGQEIQMYDDHPSWQTLTGLMESLYHHNPVKLDIAGTVESISQITADLLYRCYNTFYNLSNMVLSIAGNFDPQVVLDLCDKILKPQPSVEIEWRNAQEPREVVAHRRAKALSVSVPIFQIGFKGEAGDSLDNLKAQVLDEILLEILCGESSPLYRRLYDQGLINSTFEYEVLAGRDYLVPMYGGESRDPDAVYAAITQEADRLRQEGIPQDAFAWCHKATYGRYVGMFSRVEAVASLMMLAHFSGLEDMYQLLDWVRDLTLDSLTQRLALDFQPQYSAVSIVEPVRS